MHAKHGNEKIVISYDVQVGQSSSRQTQGQTYSDL
jgi:hypothetical protein